MSQLYDGAPTAATGPVRNLYVAPCKGMKTTHIHPLHTWRHSHDSLIDTERVKKKHGPRHAADRRHDGYRDRGGNAHNLRAAYTHVLADALISLLAIGALLVGKHSGWIWLDPAMGLVGAAVIGRWAYCLLRDTGAILLDGGAEADVLTAIRRAMEDDADNRVTDLHVWHVRPGAYTVGLALVTHHTQAPEHYKELLRHIPHLDHILIEVNACAGESCIQLAA